MERMIFSLWGWVGRHWAALVLCLAVGLVYGLHHMVLLGAARDAGLGYHPLVVNEDEAMFTGPKAHAAEMGEVIVGDFNVAEYKDTRIYVLPFLSPLIMGTIARAVGGIERAFIVSDFLFPPIIFLLFYAFLFLLSERRLLALSGATLFIFLPQVLLAVPPITPYLQATILTLAAKGSSLYFSRVEDPQLTAPLYLAGLLFFLLIFQGRRERWIIALAGIFYGLMFYSYFYYWTYVSMALVIGIAIVWRTLPDVRNRLMMAMGLGLLFSVPHWVNASMVASLPQYPDLFDRLRPEVGRALNLEMLPLFAYLLHAILASAVWIFFRKERPGLAAFFLAFLLPIYAAYNMQVVIGFNVHPDHWFKAAMPIVNTAMLIAIYYALKKYGVLLSFRALVLPWAILAILLFLKAMQTEVASVRYASLLLLATASIGLLYSAARPRLAWTRHRAIPIGLAGLVILLFFAKGVAVQKAYIRTNAAKTLPAEESASFAWLAENTPAYSVVATPSFTTNARIQLYTRNRLLLPNGYNTIAGDAELWERLRVTNKIFGTPLLTYRAYLTGASALGGGGEDDAAGDNLYFAFKPQLDTLAVYYLFHMHYLDSSPGSTFQSTTPLSLPPAIVEREVAAYQRFTPGDPLPYRVDFLYYGPRERVLVPDASAFSSYEKMYDHRGIIVYRYSHDRLAEK